MSIFDKLFAKDSVSEPYPAHPGERFTVFKGQSGGELLIISVNMAYKTWPGKREYPWLLLVTLPPFNDVVEDHVSFEHEINNALAPVCRYQYYGHALIEWYWESMYYLDQPEEAVDVLDRLADSNKVGEFQFMCSEDPKWEHAAQFWDRPTS